MPVFQPLKNGQVIPFGPRNILRIRGIGGGPECVGTKKRKQSEADNQQGGEREIHQHLARIKKLGFLLGVKGSSVNGPAAPALRKRKMCEATKTKMHAGIRKTCATKKREMVSVPMSVPPRIKRFKLSPTSGNFADRVGSHSGGEIGALVPGEQVAGEGHGEDESEENAAGKPEQFAAAFVGAVDVGLRKVEQQDDDHRGGAVKMQTAKERTGGDAFCDVGDGGVRVVGGGNVIEREENSGDDLRNKNEQQAGAENVSEASAAGNGFIQRGAQAERQARCGDSAIRENRLQ